MKKTWSRPCGRELDEPLGQLERLRVAHLERRREVHLGRLLGDRLDDLRPAVAGVDAPQAGDAVEDLAAVRRPVVHASRLASRRGALLNWRLAVNGIQ